MDSIVGVIGLVLGFSSLIFVHELGHFLLAKWNGVKVQVFSIGMGPYIVSFSHKGTIYALSLIPLGGYVKMLGQDDLNADVAANKNPGDFRNKRPGQRAAILVAGAAFNVILTIVIFFVCYWTGIYNPSPRVGNIPPDRPLAKAVMDNDPSKPANIQKGDRIVRVNGILVKSNFDVMMQVTACPAGTPIVLAIQRNDTMKRGLEYVRVEIEKDKKRGIPNIGLDPSTIYKEREALPLGFTAELQVFVAEDPADPVKSKDIKDGAAAKTGKFKKGDQILEIIDNRDPAKPVTIAMDSEYSLINTAAASEGKEHIFKLKRADGTTEPELVHVTPQKSEKGDGFKFGLAQNVLKRVTKVDPDSLAAKAGLQVGDYVLGFQAEESEVHNHPWRKGKLIWKRNFADEKTTQTPFTLPEGPIDESASVFYQEYESEDFFKAGGPSGGAIDALGQAWDDTRNYTVCMFATIKNLVTGNVNIKNLSGPVGIGHSIFAVASNKDMKMYLWWLAFISLNLGVMQLLPIPLLDGFHLLLVLIEKIKGSAVSAKVQEKFFYAGMAMIGSLLVFVMWNDISNFFR